MMATTHRLGGIAVGITAATLLNTDISGAAVILAGSLIGSIFPDIDNPNSRISHKMPITALIVSIGQKIIRSIASTFPKKQKQYITSLIGHRGVTHSLIGSVILPIIILLIGLLFKLKIRYILLMSFSVFLGHLSHLILDMLSGGIPLFMPFSTKQLVIAKIKTGGYTEWIFRLFLMLVLIVCLANFR